MPLDFKRLTLLGEGITSWASRLGTGRSRKALLDLRRSAQAANRALGVKSVSFDDLPDNRFDSVNRLEIIKRVEAKTALVRPHVVYTHCAVNLNVDHQITHEAVTTACRPIPGQTVETPLFFEVASSTEWRAPQAAGGYQPNWFVDISRDIKAKLDALGHYASEMRPWPHARSLQAVEALARRLGATAGEPAAETFIL